MTDVPKNVAWSPQPGPQTLLVSCPVEDCAYGGARGGGKTSALVGDAAIRAGRYGKAFNGLFLRRSLTELVDVKQQMQEIYPKLGATWAESRNEWVFPGGGMLHLAYLDEDSDADNYQGWNLCVGVGTPVFMADGSWKAIESVHPGEMVSTLEGPKEVLAVTRPYEAQCSEIRLSVPGVGEVARQIQPVSHHLLTSGGVRGGPSLREAQRSRLLGRVASVGTPGSSSSWNQPREGWLSYAEAVEICSGGSCDGPPASWPPVALSIQLALHGPALRSTLERLDVSSVLATGFRSDDRSGRQSQPRFRGSLSESTGRLLPPGLSRSTLGRCAFGDEFPRALTGGLSHSSEEDSAAGCRPGRGSCGEPLLSSRENGLGGLPSRVGAALRDRVDQPRDGMDSARADIQPHALSWVHFYTGEERCLRVDLGVGSMSMAYVGPRLVADLTVADVAHYITAGGVVNQNTAVYVDEAGAFPSPAPIDKLWGTLRSAQGIPCVRRMSLNPGGPGHSWCFKRYIKDHTPGAPFRWAPQPEIAPDLKITSVFIPSRLEDNQILMKKDPSYELKLAATGDAMLYRAWRYGDWDALSGGYFACFDRKKHTFVPKPIPYWFDHWISIDWGFSHDSAVYWGAFDGQKVLVYREYVASGSEYGDPVRLALEIVSRTPDEVRPSAIYMSPDAFARRSSERSIALDMDDVFRAHDFPSLTRAENERISGWQVVNRRFADNSLSISEDCPKLIDCIPSLVRDPKRPEDILKVDGDDPADSLRYLIASKRDIAPNVPESMRLAEKITATDPQSRYMQMRIAMAAEKQLDYVPRHSGRREIGA